MTAAATDTNGRRRSPRSWGKVRRLPSGRFQASYLDAAKTRRTAPETFGTRLDADAWLNTQRAALGAGTWRDPAAGAETFGGYSTRWLAERGVRPRTEDGYRRILNRFLLPAFGPMPLREITPAVVRSWYARLDPAAPVMRSHAYGLLRAIMRTAPADDLIAASPCRIRGAGQAKRATRTVPATIAEIGVITEAMPPRLALIIPLAAWCGLRFGELAALRRADVDLAAGVLRVRRGVVRAGGEWFAGPPKTEAGVRDVAMQRQVVDAARGHLDEHAGPEPGALLFTGTGGGYLSAQKLYESYYPARAAAGRPDLRFHDLRH
jgi:integrase